MSGGLETTFDLDSFAVPAAAVDLVHGVAALGLVSAERVDALLRASGPVYDLPGLLVANRLVSPQTLAALGLEQYERTGFDTDFVAVDSHAVALVDLAHAARRRFLPLALQDGRVHVAVAELLDVRRIEEIRSALPDRAPIVPELWPAAELRDALEMAFEGRFELDAVLAEIVGIEAQAAAELEKTAGGPRRPAMTRPAFELRRRPGPGSVVQDGPRRLWSDPGVRLLNGFAQLAVLNGASLLTFDRRPGGAAVGLRVHGRTMRIRMIAERHVELLTQAYALEAGDGALTLRLGAERHGFSLFRAGDTAHRLSVRRLGRQVSAISGLGLAEGPARLVRGILARPRGLVLIASPQGNGRSETLAALGRAAAGSRRQAAMVAPRAEFDLSDIAFAEARDDADAAEAICRLIESQTDIVLIDDAGGQASWAAALDGALAGALVLLTLKASDAASALARLRGHGLIGAEMALALRGVVAQALVPALCSGCKQPRAAKAAERQILGAGEGEAVMLFEAAGCDACGGTGRAGYVPVAEVLPVDGALAPLIEGGAGRATLIGAVRRKWGVQSIQADGFARVRAGTVSLNDLLQRVDAGGEV